MTLMTQRFPVEFIARLTAATVALQFSIVLNARGQSSQQASTQLCGPYSCEKVPVPGLPMRGAAANNAEKDQILKGQKHQSKRPIPDQTSSDLYCETMTIAFFETALENKPPSSPEHAKRLEGAEREMFDTCKSMPIVGGKEKMQRDMTPQELSLISCLATADGIATAHYSKTGDRLLYSKLSQRRQSFSEACASKNKSLFLSDMRKYGPHHVLSKN